MKKKRFNELLQKNGFRSIHMFAKAGGMDAPNLYTNLNGKSTLGITRAFLYANTLGVPIDEILEIFWPEQMRANREACVSNKEHTANEL